MVHGRVLFGPNGRLQADILAAYREHCFNVFKGAVDATEIEEVRRVA